MSSSAAKVFIQIESEAEQQEHLKNQRKTLKPIQGCADKENLTGRAPHLDQLSRLKQATVGNSAVLATPEYGKRKRLEPKLLEAALKVDAQTQTQTAGVGLAEEDASDKAITVEDLTSANEPGENYYKRLAETRRAALEETLSENQRLNQRIEGLEEELDTARKELTEVHHLVTVLKEMIAETEQEEGDDANENVDERTSDVATQATEDDEV